MNCSMKDVLERHGKNVDQTRVLSISAAVTVFTSMAVNADPEKLRAFAAAYQDSEEKRNRLDALLINTLDQLFERWNVDVEEVEEDGDATMMLAVHLGKMIGGAIRFGFFDRATGAEEEAE